MDKALCEFVKTAMELDDSELCKLTEEELVKIEQHCENCEECRILVEASIKARLLVKFIGSETD